ncbi:MAG TPA: DUF2752 domain-containing protein [Candidatus Polarisedimenticolia bacterium]|nr:DUF2752 domain-containing protein [Candidatus Polarisedimenticolia bacterium]
MPGAQPPVVGDLLARAARLRRASLALAIPLLLAAARLLPAERPLPFDLCVLHRLTGLDCLTCGLTRAVCLLVRGRAAESLRMHPAGAPLVTGFVVASIWIGVEAAVGRRIVPRRRPRAGA